MDRVVLPCMSILGAMRDVLEVYFRGGLLMLMLITWASYLIYYETHLWARVIRAEKQADEIRKREKEQKTRYSMRQIVFGGGG
jgi:hypothetical protein